jgi:hypothetical protein
MSTVYRTLPPKKQNAPFRTDGQRVILSGFGSARKGKRRNSSSKTWLICGVSPRISSRDALWIDELSCSCETSGLIITPACMRWPLRAIFSNRFMGICPVQSQWQIYFPFRLTDSYLEPPPSHPQRGGSRVVTNAGWDAVDAAASARSAVAGRASACERRAACGRTALQRLRQDSAGSTWPVESFGWGRCVRRSRVVLASVADVKLAEAKSARPGLMSR